MKKNPILAALLFIIVALSPVFALAPQAADAGLDQIVLYQVTDKMATSAPLKGVGMNGFKLTVGQEIIIFAKGLDKAGNEVPVYPTWKADQELGLTVVEGRSKTVLVKGLKAGAPLFITAVYIKDDGKKVTGEVMGSVK